MKKFAFVLLAGLGLLLQANAAELKWHTDMSKALQEAQAEDKKVLIDFTGSDW
jgi:hypothetical protein